MFLIRSNRNLSIDMFLISGKIGYLFRKGKHMKKIGIIGI